MKLLKTLAYWVAGLVGIWLVLCAFAGELAMNWALHPGRRPLQPDAGILAMDISAKNHTSFETASVVADDGAILQGWYLRPSVGNNDVVMLLHGQGDNRTGMLGAAEMFLRHGYSVLLPDARAQGMSGGAVVTYGVKEGRDVHKWFDWLESEQHPDCIFGLGNSMGAAELLQSLTTERRFCAVVAESPFASFREASFERIGQWTGTGPWIGRTLLNPVVWFGLQYGRWHYGVDLTNSDPGESVAIAQVPVMLIHGMKDDNLPPRHSEEILDEAQGRNRNVILWEPPDAGHCGAASAEPGDYEQRVIGWFVVHRRVGNR